MSLADVAAGDDRLASLKKLRDMLAADLDETESKRDVAALSQRFMDVLDKIAEAERLTPAKAGTGLDEFTQRRAQSASAKGPARPARRVERSG